MRAAVHLILTTAAFPDKRSRGRGSHLDPKVLLGLAPGKPAAPPAELRRDLVLDAITVQVPHPPEEAGVAGAHPVLLGRVVREAAVAAVLGQRKLCMLLMRSRRPSVASGGCLRE